MGPADRLDVDRQALFFLELIRTHHDDFGDALIEEIGVDARVQEAVLSRLRAWARGRRHGATRALVDELARRMTADFYEGWSTSHHHHLHLRLQRVDALGPLRPAVEALLDRERALDLELASGQNPVLVTRLRSCGLERRLELSIVRGRGVTRVEYRVDGRAWRGPAVGQEPFRHVEELPGHPGRQGSQLLVEARLTLESGTQQVLSRRIAVPRQDPELWTAVRPEQIRVGASRAAAESVRLWVDMPSDYRQYVTGVRYVLTPRQGRPIVGETRTAGSWSRAYAVRLDLPAARRDIVLAQVVVELSGRVEVSIPFVLPEPRAGPPLWE